MFITFGLALVFFTFMWNETQKLRRTSDPRAGKMDIRGLDTVANHVSNETIKLIEGGMPRSQEEISLEEKLLEEIRTVHEKKD